MANDLFCFHCGLPVIGKAYYTLIKQNNQPMCCIGCQMVAEAIINNGLENYYDLRDKKSFTQKNLIPPELLELKQFDVTSIQKKFIQDDTLSDQVFKKIILSIEGLTCAACVWLLEKRVSKLQGVVKFTINFSNQRAELIWNEPETTLSYILLEIAKIGFRAQPFEINQEEVARKIEYRQALKRLAISGFGFGQVMMFAAPLYDWFSHGIPVYYRDFFRVVSLVVTTPVLIYCGMPFFKSSWNSLKARYLTMDVSITLALLVVYISGIYATVMRTGEVYFDSITMFLFFITLSRYLEMRARFRASFVIQQLSHQQPNWVTRIVHGMSEVVAIHHVIVGDTIVVKSGEIIPVDGTVLEGSSSVSESLLTGEALPKMKLKGDAVVSGSLNMANPLTIVVTRTGDETTLATILKLYERAQFDKPKIVTFTQTFSHYFILIQMMVAALLFLYWLPTSVEHAFWLTISLLVISCPCALAIATPIALTASMNALSKIGFLCTRGNVLENLSQPTDIIFDKTGTLTEGKFTIREMQLFSHVSKDDVLAIAASLEAQSEHPIASAFKRNEIAMYCENMKVHPNLGVEGNVNGVRYFLGNHQFIHANTQLQYKTTKSELNATTVILATQSAIIAAFSLSDQLRPHAETAIRYFLTHGYRVHLLSGDNAEVVKHYATMLQIKHYFAEYSPADKLNYVKSLQEKGAKVVMLGDGINDAPVLMQAQISIAMAGAADITRVSADAVLMNNDLSTLITVFNQVKKTHTIIKQCLYWAMIYNLICLPLAISGLVAPYVAAALMSCSSILVVGNALRLMYIKPNAKNETMPSQLILTNC